MAAGELITIAPALALALARKGLVSLSRHYQTRDLAPEPEPETPKRRGRPRKNPEDGTPKRRYQRRDMQAETE